MSKEVEKVDQGRIDELIWRGIGVKSVRVIAEEAGVRPDEVLRRKNELLDEIDVLTIQEKRARLLVRLQEIANSTQEDYEASPYEFKAGLMNSAIAAIKTVLQELARMDKQDSSKVEALNQKRIAELVDLVREVVDVSVSEISEEHGLDEDEVYDVFNRNMIEAASKRDMGSV